MIEVSHPERVLFPGAGITKGEVVAYYRRAAAAMLPHLRDRPLTLQRFPRGIAAKGFLQKNAGKHFPDLIERIDMPKRGGVTRHPAVRDAEGLAYLANQGTVALHIPGARAAALSCPDRLVIDLDPPEGALARVKQAAWLVRALLVELGVEALPLATGGKGYHLVAAIAPQLSFDVLDDATRKLSALLAARHPEVVTSEFRIAKRGGRVFIDWLRNRFGATAVAPWSLRGRSGAPVAVPLSWDELDQSQPAQWTLRTAPERMLNDPLAAAQQQPLDPRPFVEAVNTMAADEGIVLQPFDRFRS